MKICVSRPVLLMLCSTFLMQATQVQAEETLAINFATLAKRYIQHHREEFLSSDKLVLAYTNRFLCAEYQHNAHNEFTLPDVLKKAQEEIKSLNEAEQPLIVRDYGTFGNYDLHTGAFPFSPMNEQRNIVTLKDTADNQPACTPTMTGWPKEFQIVVENYDLIQGIPMPKEKAQALVEDRHKNAGDDRKVGINYTLQFKQWGKVDEHYTATVTAAITGVTLDDNTGATPRVLYTYDPAYLATRQAEVDKRLAKEREEPIEYSAENLKLWFDALAAQTPHNTPDSAKLRPLLVPAKFNVLHSGKGVTVDGLSKGAELKAYFPDSSPVSIEIMNAAELEDLIPLPPGDVQKIADNLANAAGYILITPVGMKPAAGTDPARIYAHIGKVLIKLLKDGKEADRVEAASPSEPKPYAEPSLTPPAPPETKNSR